MGVTNYRRIYGIDFSGAKDAGKKIWIASGTVEQDGLLIEECYRAGSLGFRVANVCSTTHLGV